MWPKLYFLHVHGHEGRHHISSPTHVCKSPLQTCKREHGCVHHLCLHSFCSIFGPFYNGDNLWPGLFSLTEFCYYGRDVFIFPNLRTFPNAAIICEETPYCIALAQTFQADRYSTSVKLKLTPILKKCNMLDVQPLHIKLSHFYSHCCLHLKRQTYRVLYFSSVVHWNKQPANPCPYRDKVT